MSAIIIDGKQIASSFRKNLKEKISNLKNNEKPVLAVISVGEDAASKIYVKTKKKYAEEMTHKWKNTNHKCLIPFIWSFWT